MDRLNQIRGEAGSSRDLTLDSTSPSEAYITANDNNSKYFSISEGDSSFGISPTKDSLPETITTDSELISNLSPISKSIDDSYDIGKQIEAANILSGGVDIFDNNDNSYDGDELVIDDNIVEEDKIGENLCETMTTSEKAENLVSAEQPEELPSKDTEVVLQIDGQNVNAIDIGNGLYLYRKPGQEELAVVQIIDDDQNQPSFKFLKVRENLEGSLVVYEEIKVEVPHEVPTKEDKSDEIMCPHVPIQDINKVINEPVSKVTDKTLSLKTLKSESILNNDCDSEITVDLIQETKVNGKMKFNESRKSPVIGAFMPRTYHSTPNKEGIPLTKTMVDQQLTNNPSRSSDNIKKTIEVHTDNCRQKLPDTPPKSKNFNETLEAASCNTKKENDIINKKSSIPKEVTTDTNQTESTTIETNPSKNSTIASCTTEEVPQANKDASLENELIENAEKELQIFSHKESTTKISEDNKKLKLTLDEKLCSELDESKEDIDNSNFDIMTNNKIENTLVSHEIKNNLKESNEVIESDPKSGDNQNSGQTTSKKEIEVIAGPDKIADKINLTTSEIPHQNKLNVNMNSTPINQEGQNISVTNENKNNVADQVSDDNVLIIDDEENINQDDKNNLCTNTVHTKLTPDVTKNADVESEISSNDIKVTEPKQNINKLISNSENEIEKSTTEIDDKILSVDKKDCKEDDKNNVKEMLDQVDSFLPKTEITNVTDISELEVSQDIKNAISTQQSKEIKNKPENCKQIKNTNLALDSNKMISGLKASVEKNKVTSKVEQLKNIAPPKPIINNNNPVPFGKWTEANRQEFLNKIKETKIPTTHTNTKQLKQPNDLNRRDVLKKIDSQRQTSTVFSKVPVSVAPKVNSIKETAVFTNKPSTDSQTNPIETKGTSEKNQQSVMKTKVVTANKIRTDEPINFTLRSKKCVQRKEINNQDLIDKTIEGIINRAVTGKTADNAPEITIATEIETHVNSQTALDDIEMKMNELHGIQIDDHIPQKISDAYSNTIWSKSKNNKMPSLLPFKSKESNVKDSVGEEPSDEEIIEHEPITGDIEHNKQSIQSLLSNKERTPEPRKETIITENEFDKFARRNSITYENCLTVNFDGKEPHSVVQTVVEKELPVKKMSRNEMMLAESKAKSTNKHHNIMKHSNQHSKMPINTASEEDAYNKKYQSKVQQAYQTAIIAKKHVECPITIIEDKPVKVVFMDQNMDYTPMHLNVQGHELSPSKTFTSDSDTAGHSASESLDSDILESTIETKILDETKSKSKHQRKQVLTPVEEPELELIEPGDLGIEISPKKKRKLDDKNEKPNKNLVPKKSYLLNRNIANEHLTKQSENRNVEFTTHTDTISAIDNLVKAAELIETISEKKNAASNLHLRESQQNTPVKRGRGRPRKYPLPESGIDTKKTPSPQKKPRLIDAKPRKSDTESDTDTDGEIKENWTMGKINENIVCPICNKLFRSENVVFKHVKHCTGASPNRSDSDKRSPRRFRHSPDSDSDSDYTDDEKVNLKSRKSNNRDKSIDDDEDVIVIKDTPLKEKSEKKVKKFINKDKTMSRTNDIICEICGKSFRQLSYLINHKLQHKNEIKNEKEEQITSKSVFCCEVCKKQFRKLHHLVQHRIIHNPSSMSNRLLRKSSSEQRDNKSTKNVSDIKPSDDASAGFRCEPCDKSFRKLHHLVEHRETHDGINKRVNTQSNTDSSNKPSIAYHCDKCNKIFKKLQDYLEHKDQHLETSSEKSDDKSVKSSLSTKDIIHECSLCYMVFPNEHSLNKHTFICLRKKRQSAAKKAAKETDGQETIDIDDTNDNDATNMLQDDEAIEKGEDEMPLKSKESSDVFPLSKDEEKSEVPSHTEVIELLDKRDNSKENKSNDIVIKPEKRLSVETKLTTVDVDEYEKPNKIKKIEENTIIVIPDTPIVKKKIPAKDKAATVVKRHKTVNIPLPSVDDLKPLEGSDDDEIRYMLNPDFQEDENTNIKFFFNERAKKRNSLQFDRPSQDLVKRRISLQHPPKIPRLKVKAVEARPVTSLEVENKIKTAELPITQTAQSTDSDDSDIKYSFPEQTTNDHKVEKVEKRGRKSLSAKRKSLTGIAKRKSLGTHKVTPTNKIKKRTTVVEHRCDCGQLFSSAALLSRHATLAHTPPRRRRLSPLVPPEQDKHAKPRTQAKTNALSHKTNLQSSKTNVQSSKIVAQPSKTILQPSKTIAQPSKINLQSCKTVAQSSKTNSQPSKAVSQPLKTNLQSSKTIALPHKTNTLPPKTNPQSSKTNVQTIKPSTKTKVQSTKIQSPKTQVPPKKLKYDTSTNKHKKSGASSDSTSESKAEFVGKKLRSSCKGAVEPEKPRKHVDKLKK